jgi:hypothetical protein
MYNGLIIGLVILAVLLLGGFITSMLIHMFSVPAIFTPKKLLKEIADIIKLTEDDVLYELGAGHGRVSFELSKQDPKSISLYEISPLLAMQLRLKLVLNRVKGDKTKINLITENIFSLKYEKQDELTVIYAYLSEEAMKKLEPKVIPALNKDVTLYSYKYKFPNLKENKRHTLSNGEVLFVY